MSGNSKSMENQAKFCQGRVTLVEKHFGLLCHTLGSITRKTARLRDKGDLLSKQLLQYAESENISHSSKVGVVHFAESIAAIQDYRQAEVQRLDAKVVTPLSTYGNRCKEIKNGIKNEMKALSKEKKMAGKLDKVRQKTPGDARLIVQAESELQKAAQNANVGSKALDEQILKFESQKLKDLKQVLTDFVHIEMVFHAKALEYYSRCFESINHISEDMDLEEFERKLQASRGPGWQAMMLNQSLSSGSGMSSTQASSLLTSPENTGSFGESTTSLEKRVGFAGQSMYDDDDDDDDDDDEDDDDEEDLPTRR